MAQGYCHVHMEERGKDLQETELLSNVILYCGEEQADYSATIVMEQWERYHSSNYSIFTLCVRTGLTQ